MEVEVSRLERIDSFLSKELDISRNKISRLIDEGKVTYKGKVVKASDKLDIGSIVSINDELDFTITSVPEDIPLDIRYEDKYLMVINKESGMVVHPAPGNYTGTLVNALLFYLNKSSTKNLRPFIVHRIDKDTSGLMVVAKDDKVETLLGEMVRNKEIERKYYALVYGVIPNDTGTIDAPIGRDEKNKLKMAVTKNGKNAITHFKVIKRYNDKTLIECTLVTGRTHQIRCHMAYIGYPLYNDPIYSNRKSDEFGQFLHSHSIKFIHPITKKEINIECELPKRFKDYLDNLDNLV